MKNFKERPQVKEQDVRDALNKITSGQVFIVRNNTKTTVLDVKTATLTEVANVLATLVKDLQRRNLLGE